MGQAPSHREVLGGLLMGASRQSFEAFETVVAEAGFTPSLARLMFALEQPTAMSAVAAELRCDASQITGLADKLDDLGLVDRVPDPRDRRVKLLTLTAKGRATFDDLHARTQAAAFPVDRLTTAERLQLIDLLTKVVGR